MGRYTQSTYRDEIKKLLKHRHRKHKKVVVGPAKNIILSYKGKDSVTRCFLKISKKVESGSETCDPSNREDDKIMRDKIQKDKEAKTSRNDLSKKKDSVHIKSTSEPASTGSNKKDCLKVLANMINDAGAGESSKNLVRPSAEEKSTLSSRCPSPDQTPSTSRLPQDPDTHDKQDHMKEKSASRQNEVLNLLARHVLNKVMNGNVDKHPSKTSSSGPSESSILTLKSNQSDKKNQFDRKTTNENIKRKLKMETGETKKQRTNSETTGEITDVQLNEPSKASSSFIGPKESSIQTLKPNQSGKNIHIHRKTTNENNKRKQKLKTVKEKKQRIKPETTGEIADVQLKEHSKASSSFTRPKESSIQTSKINQLDKNVSHRKTTVENNKSNHKMETGGAKNQRTKPKATREITDIQLNKSKQKVDGLKINDVLTPATSANDKNTELRNANEKKKKLKPVNQAASASKSDTQEDTSNSMHKLATKSVQFGETLQDKTIENTSSINKSNITDNINVNVNLGQQETSITKTDDTTMISPPLSAKESSSNNSNAMNICDLMSKTTCPAQNSPEDNTNFEQSPNTEQPTNILDKNEQVNISCEDNIKIPPLNNISDSSLLILKLGYELLESQSIDKNFPTDSSQTNDLSCDRINRDPRLNRKTNVGIPNHEQIPLAVNPNIVHTPISINTCPQVQFSRNAYPQVITADSNKVSSERGGSHANAPTSSRISRDPRLNRNQCNPPHTAEPLITEKSEQSSLPAENLQAQDSKLAPGEFSLVCRRANKFDTNVFHKIIYNTLKRDSACFGRSRHNMNNSNKHENMLNMPKRDLPRHRNKSSYNNKHNAIRSHRWSYHSSGTYNGYVNRGHRFARSTREPSRVVAPNTTKRFPQTSISAKTAATQSENSANSSVVDQISSTFSNEISPLSSVSHTNDKFSVHIDLERTTEPLEHGSKEITSGSSSVTQSSFTDNSSSPLTLSTKPIFDSETNKDCPSNVTSNDPCIDREPPQVVNSEKNPQSLLSANTCATDTQPKISLNASCCTVNNVLSDITDSNQVSSQSRFEASSTSDNRNRDPCLARCSEDPIRAMPGSADPVIASNTTNTCVTATLPQSSEKPTFHLDNKASSTDSVKDSSIGGDCLAKATSSANVSHEFTAKSIDHSQKEITSIPSDATPQTSGINLSISPSSLPEDSTDVSNANKNCSTSTTPECNETERHLGADRTNLPNPNISQINTSSSSMNISVNSSLPMITSEEACDGVMFSPEKPNLPINRPNNNTSNIYKPKRDILARYETKNSSTTNLSDVELSDPRLGGNYAQRLTQVRPLILKTIRYQNNYHNTFETN